MLNNKERLVVGVKAAVHAVVADMPDDVTVLEGSNRIAVQIGPHERYLIVVQKTQASRMQRAGSPTRTDFS
jgi:hypothetical protein